MIWSEIFSRSTMYLATLSGAIVALALVGQRATFDDTFLNFTILVLPLVLFVGWTTLARLSTSNSIEAACVAGMNRIRGAYVRLIPDLEPIFVMSTHDDIAGVSETMGYASGQGSISRLISAMPVVIAMINAAVLAAFAGAVAARLNADGTTVIAVGLTAFLVSIALSARVGQRRDARELTGPAAGVPEFHGWQRIRQAFLVPRLEGLALNAPAADRSVVAPLGVVVFDALDAIAVKATVQELAPFLSATIRSCAAAALLPTAPGIRALR